MNSGKKHNKCDTIEDGFFDQNGCKVTNLNILMWASKCYAVQIIQCMARSDIYEGRYDFYLDGVLSVWIWSVPCDQEPIYQPDSWRCVRRGTSAIMHSLENIDHLLGWVLAKQRNAPTENKRSG